MQYHSLIICKLRDITAVLTTLPISTRPGCLSRISTSLSLLGGRSSTLIGSLQNTMNED
jgi:hypothetical protein